MAQSRALAGQGEAITQTEQIVTSALDYMVWVSLPLVVSGGAGAAVDYDHIVSVMANGQGAVEVVDAAGNRVTIIKPMTQASFRSRAGTIKPWEVIINASGSLLPTIADLAVTDGAVGASGVTMPASYAEATTEAAVDAAIDANSALAEALLATSFGEVEAKCNAILASLVAMGIVRNNDTSEGTTELALALTTASVQWQVVDDDETFVTSARATDCFCTLPDISAAGTTTTTRDGTIVRIAANSSGRIYVRDFQHRHVCTVPAWTSMDVIAQDYTVNKHWAVIGSVSPALSILVPQPYVAPLSVTLPTFTASSALFAAAYTDDATYLAAVEATVDTAAAGMATSLAVAFAEVETFVNAILVAMEVSTLHAAS